MKIGINAYPLSRKFSGPSVYLFNVLKYLEIMDKENEYYLYSRNGLKLPFTNNPRWHIIITEGFLNYSSTLWMLTALKKRALKDKIDIFWGTENVLPLNLPKIVKKVLTVHDLVWYYYPEVLNWDNSIILPLFAKRSIEVSDHIITISHSIVDEIKKEFKVPSEDLSVIYLGVSDKFKHLDQEESSEFIAKKHNVSNDYILFVGNIEPKKNLLNLLKAFKIFTQKFSLKHQLLLVGSKRYNSSGIYKTYKKLKFTLKEAAFLDCVDFQDLPYFYSGAKLFIMPSFYEGFGLPPLEAMACGTPIVASDIPVFREILGDAALLVDPFAPEKIANAIYRVLTDNALAKVLTQKGIERIKQFSWETTAKETLGIFEKIIKRKNND